ncbi:MAG: winged helix-turn-helix transcriptional regulator [Thiohalorhabdaceae bacterium]
MDETRSDTHRSGCPLAGTLDLVGDKWSLVILRDIMAGKHKFSELQEAPEGIPTNILSARLNRLVCEDILAKRPYQERPARYAYVLTEKGADLLPLIQEAARWGQKYLPGRTPVPEWFMRADPETVMNSQS